MPVESARDTQSLLRPAVDFIFNLWLSIAMKKLPGFTQKAIAEDLKISPAAVSKWFKRGRIPLERVPDIERLTGISRHELRPDFFGPAPPATGQEAAA